MQQRSANSCSHAITTYIPELENFLSLHQLRIGMFSLTIQHSLPHSLVALSLFA